jgi:histone deacetylase complex regulatory component SIN3
VYDQVTKLFQNAPDLIDEFKQFLPEHGGVGGMAALFPASVPPVERTTGQKRTAKDAKDVAPPKKRRGAQADGAKGARVSRPPRCMTSSLTIRRRRHPRQTVRLARTARRPWPPSPVLLLRPSRLPMRSPSLTRSRSSSTTSTPITSSSSLSTSSRKTCSTPRVSSSAPSSSSASPARSGRRSRRWFSPMTPAMSRPPPPVHRVVTALAE